MKTKKQFALSVYVACVSLLIASNTVWAQDRHDYGYSPRNSHGIRQVVRVAAPPNVYYGYAPAPIYYVPPLVYAPAPAYYAVPAYYDAPPVADVSLPIGAVGGTLVGAAIGNGMGQGNGRTAAIAIGSVIGAIIGNQLTAGQ